MSKHKLTAEEIEALRALWARLMQAHPAAFSAPPRPLKIGIGADVLAAHPDIEPRMLGHVMRRWCGRPSYLKALMRADVRVDLSGAAAGEVSAEQKVDAEKRLKIATERGRKKHAAADMVPVKPRFYAGP